MVIPFCTSLTNVSPNFRNYSILRMPRNNRTQSLKSIGKYFPKTIKLLAKLLGLAVNEWYGTIGNLIICFLCYHINCNVSKPLLIKCI